MDGALRYISRSTESQLIIWKSGNFQYYSNPVVAVYILGTRRKRQVMLFGAYYERSGVYLLGDSIL